MRVALVVSLAAVAVAAATASVTPAAARNPCKLVTAADVKAVLGTSAGRGKLQTLGLYESCTYTTKSFVTVSAKRALARM